jgi:glutamine amidotransferase
MCRLLYVHSETEFDAAEHLRPFAALSRASREFQGDGWGCAVWRNGGWQLQHDIRPVWEDDPARIGRTRRLLAHARSAFEDRDVRVENNMPFHDGRFAFAFNGELRGVRLTEEGRIGAEKVFNFVKRFDRGDPGAALRRALPLIEKRSARVRAMNVILADDRGAWAASLHREDADYFTLRRKRQSGVVAVCSEPYPGESGWEPLPNDSVEKLP